MENKFWSDFIKGALLGCIGIIIGISTIIYFCYASVNWFVNSCTSRELKDAQEWGNFIIPEQATDVEVCYSAWQNHTVHARFELPPSKLETFLQSTKITSALSTTGKPTRFWKRDQEAYKVEKYLYGKYTDDTFTQEILIDTSNLKQYVAYIWVTGGD